MPRPAQVPASPADRRPGPGRNRGVSLLEVVVALAVLAVALAGLAPALVQCTVLLVDARAETRALALTVTRMEQLRALVFEQDAASLLERTDTVTNLANDPPSTDGTGLGPGSADTAWIETSGFADVVDETGAPGRGQGQDVFTRRWAVSTLPTAFPTPPLLIQVVARDAARERREAARSSSTPRPGDVWLFTLRARVRR